MSALTRGLRAWTAVLILIVGEVLSLAGVLLVGLANWIAPDDFPKD